MKVKWEGYSEPTWEIFSSFVKDTAPMVERYLIRKSLLKSLQEYQELYQLKPFEIKSTQANSQQKSSKATSGSSATVKQSVPQTPVGAQSAPDQPIIYEK